MTKVNVISTKLIKPWTPTPQNLNQYKISLTDELCPPMYVSVILFYPKPNPTTSSHLRESLSKTLPQFYPFAGRYIKRDHSVDCNDEGAEFVEAEETDDIELMSFLAGTKTYDQLKLLLSRQTYDVIDKATDPLLSIQTTRFKCGGLSISVSVSHRVSDAASLGTFIAAWSDATNSNNPTSTIPSFDSRSLFPGINLEYDFEPPLGIVVKRLLFNKEAISSLRSKLANDLVSRVRVVSSLIARALIGVDIAKHGKTRDCYLAQAIDMRGRTTPPLPRHSCGNLSVESITQCMYANETKEMLGVQELVSIFGDAIDKSITDCAELLSVGEDRRVEIIMEPIADFVKKESGGDIYSIWFSDWSKVRFYDADFGWGKPDWVAIGTLPGENFTLLMDSKEGDGIEAWVYLNQNDVPYFEQDEDVKLFTIA